MNTPVLPPQPTNSSSPNEDRTSARLRRAVALLAAAALLACGAVLVRSCGPDPALLAQRDAARAAARAAWEAWEAKESPQQRAERLAWDESVRELRRVPQLIGLVWLLGTLVIAAAFAGSTRASARKIKAQELTLKRAWLRLLAHGTLGLAAAFAIIISAPMLEKMVFGGGLLYSGEIALSALLTAMAFVLAWVVLFAACALLLRARSRARASPRAQASPHIQQ